MTRSQKDGKGGHRKPSSLKGRWRCKVKMRTYGRAIHGFIQEYRRDGEFREAMRGRARNMAKYEIRNEVET